MKKENINTVLLTVILAQLRAMVSTLEDLETEVATNQEKLNQISSDLNEATQNVRSEIDSLKQQVAAGTAPEQLDFSGLDDAVRQLQQSTSAVESGEPVVDNSLPQTEQQRRK